MTETEDDIKREIKIKRLNVTIVLLIICFAISCILYLSAFSLATYSILDSYITGLIFAFIGLTYRSILFQDYVDSYEGNYHLLKKQIKIVSKTYFLKYMPLIVFYAIISVSLIHLLFVRNEEITWIHILLLSASNIVIGVFVEPRKLF